MARKIDDVRTTVAHIARDLAMKAMETQKLTYTGSQPKDLGEAVGELYAAILDRITKD